MDEITVRFVALFVLVTTVIALAMRSPWVLLALAVDFSLRASGRQAWSPLGRLASVVRGQLRLGPRPVNAGPKRFAAWVGAGFALGIAAALASGHALLSLGLGLALGLCAVLEGSFGLCVGCWLYTLLGSLRRSVFGVAR